MNKRAETVFIQLKAFPTKVADQWEIEIHDVIVAPGYKLFADAPEEE